MHIPFHASERSSLGVEVELAIVDRGSRAARPARPPRSSRSWARATRAGAPQGEARAVRVHAGDHHRHLRHRRPRRGTISSRRSRRCRARSTPADWPCCRAGSHPFSHWRDQQVSPSPRYAALLEETQWAGKRLQIFGVHFHVGVRSAEKVIAIANALNAYIPHFLALSASSPFWEGTTPGWRRAGPRSSSACPPPACRTSSTGWQEFEEFMGTLIAAEAITSIREVWWDIRPHPDFGTVELRICDGIPTMREVASLAAMAQSLVEWMDTRLDAGTRSSCPTSGWSTRTSGRRPATASTPAHRRRPGHAGAPARADLRAGGPSSRRPLPAWVASNELTANLDVLDPAPATSRQRAHPRRRRAAARRGRLTGRRARVGPSRRVEGRERPPRPVSRAAASGCSCAALLLRLLGLLGRSLLLERLARLLGLGFGRRLVCHALSVRPDGHVFAVDFHG